MGNASGIGKPPVFSRNTYEVMNATESDTRLSSVPGEQSNTAQSVEIKTKRLDPATR